MPWQVTTNPTFTIQKDNRKKRREGKEELYGKACRAFELKTMYMLIAPFQARYFPCQGTSPHYAALMHTKPISPVIVAEDMIGVAMYELVKYLWDGLTIMTC